ncbi:hypothetical protein A2982_02610 [candidate division WWE3 bacterium RIFCSPLOWO2_01_FULL_39_13]|uniref:AAA+ ATPase domain-containing protein n=1 Tax=candidate division WWE3 bacterium RIFCSPLOWO2_01_FULL_39_13 TaxID=1802624 RepID=A0A1F4V2M7_UNCKA|nr:MAG: hypothetical protein A2982_02610 [candidate division WWE3 bacterium RIFCSPLOWO2_01_FULL_39_13]
MTTKSAQKIEELLLQKGLLTPNQYRQIQDEQLKNGLSPEEIIKRDKLVNDIDIAKAISELSSIEFVDLSQKIIHAQTTKLIQESIARQYVLMPFEYDKASISIAMTDPFDLQTIEFLERSTGLKVKTYISTEDIINTVIEREYSKSLGKDVSEAIEQATATSTKKIKESLKNIEEVNQVIKVSPVAQIVSVVLEYAVKSGASDIHIEPMEEGTRLRYRIDGVLQEKFPLPKTIHNSIIARIKILANMPIDERRKPLDGKFKVIFGETKTDLRVSTMPTVFGEKAVIRLLKDQKTTFTLNQLGMWGEGLKKVDEALKQTTGIMLVTGPTGSGKTVTLATSLDKLNTIRVNIITLEDPVEISISGVNQVQINPQAGLTFASGLRSILRQDPNIIMVGEIRDVETARLAIQAALTGHLVLATLHTNSASGAIPRLIDMGVETFLIASTVNVIMAQRLTRRICINCIESFSPEEKLKEDIKNVLGERLMRAGLGPSPFAKNQYADKTAKPAENSNNEIKLYRGKGCDRCNNTGYKGRIGIYEVMSVNSEIQKLAENNAPSDEIQKKAVENGMITLVQDGYLKALWGVTTIEEVLSVADE